jgi:hypothetical protein
LTPDDDEDHQSDLARLPQWRMPEIATLSSQKQNHAKSGDFPSESGNLPHFP